jgi:hypothetical protein
MPINPTLRKLILYEAIVGYKNALNIPNDAPNDAATNPVHIPTPTMPIPVFKFLKLIILLHSSFIYIRRGFNFLSISYNFLISSVV